MKVHEQILMILNEVELSLTRLCSEIIPVIVMDINMDHSRSTVLNNALWNSVRCFNF